MPLTNKPRYFRFDFHPRNFWMSGHYNSNNREHYLYKLVWSSWYVYKSGTWVSSASPNDFTKNFNERYEITEEEAFLEMI